MSIVARENLHQTCQKYFLYRWMKRQTRFLAEAKRQIARLNKEEVGGPGEFLDLSDIGLRYVLEGSSQHPPSLARNSPEILRATPPMWAIIPELVPAYDLFPFKRVTGAELLLTIDCRREDLLMIKSFVAWFGGREKIEEAKHPRCSFEVNEERSPTGTFVMEGTRSPSGTFVMMEGTPRSGLEHVLLVS